MSSDRSDPSGASVSPLCSAFGSHGPCSGTSHRRTQLIEEGGEIGWLGLAEEGDVALEDVPPDLNECHESRLRKNCSRIVGSNPSATWACRLTALSISASDPNST
jgi:hypothetical protein